MKINKNLLKKLSFLSKININKNKKKNIIINLNKVILWMKKLKNLNIKDIYPLENMSQEINILKNDYKKIIFFSKKKNKKLIKEKKYFKILK